MTGSSPEQSPGRVTDLVTLKLQGAEIFCRTAFEILPVDFQHRANPFRAHIFLCRFAGAVDGGDYVFRKCYARGCPNNLCPHVSQAVRIANRYLQRDYHKLKAAGIVVEERLFDLADMMVAFDQAPAPGIDIWTLPDLVAAARDGRRVNVDAALSFISAVEHFDRRDQPQTYLIGEFEATVDEAPCRCERCFACYPTEGGAADRRKAVEIADARLALLYEEFQQAGILGPRRYFLEGNGGS
jgi:hypothetical protein